jgi:hypothetical protein
MFRTVEWTEAGVVLIDQRKPTEEVYPSFALFGRLLRRLRTWLCGVLQPR